jgi:hypothetical protein
MTEEKKITDLEGVREYCEGEPVELWFSERGRIVIRAYNEARFQGTDVDLLDLIEWISQRGVVLDMDYDKIRSKLSDRTDHPLHEAEEINELRVELLKQWLDAHAEYCGCRGVPWPPDAECNWPMPSVVKDRIDPNEVYLLLLEASGEAF